MAQKGKFSTISSTLSLFNETESNYESFESCEFRPCVDSPNWSQDERTIKLRNDTKIFVKTEQEFQVKTSVKEKNNLYSYENVYSFTPKLKSIFSHKFVIKNA